MRAAAARLDILQQCWAMPQCKPAFGEQRTASAVLPCKWLERKALPTSGRFGSNTCACLIKCNVGRKAVQQAIPQRLTHRQQLPFRTQAE